MNIESNFQYLEHEDSNAVVTFDNGTTFKISKLMEKVNEFLRKLVLDGLSANLNKAGLGYPPNYKSQYWNEGVDAEILEPKSGEWKKGKVRMRVVLEFCPDEPEKIKDNSMPQVNSLDDIRQTIFE